MLKLYDFEPENGAYTGSFDASLDPLETHKQGYDVWLRPAHCTEVRPPKFDKNQVPVWKRDEDGYYQWVVVADHRRETWFRLNEDGTYSPVMVDFVGDPRECGLIAADEVPQPVPVLSEFRFKMMLIDKGVDDKDVEEAIAKSADRRRMALTWAKAPSYAVGSNLVKLLIDAKLLDASSIDDDFRSAANN